MGVTNANDVLLTLSSIICTKPLDAVSNVDHTISLPGRLASSSATSTAVTPRTGRKPWRRYVRSKRTTCKTAQDIALGARLGKWRPNYVRQIITRHVVDGHDDVGVRTRSERGGSMRKN